MSDWIENAAFMIEREFAHVIAKVGDRERVAQIIRQHAPLWQIFPASTGKWVRLNLEPVKGGPVMTVATVIERNGKLHFKTEWMGEVKVSKQFRWFGPIPELGAPSDA